MTNEQSRALIAIATICFVSLAIECSPSPCVCVVKVPQPAAATPNCPIVTSPAVGQIGGGSGLGQTANTVPAVGEIGSRPVPGPTAKTSPEAGDVGGGPVPGQPTNYLTAAGEVGRPIAGQAARENVSLKVVWDGDAEVGKGKGWADCDRKPQCKSNLAPQAGAGVKASVGLRLRGEGVGWIGGGWNFFGWWPADAGIDISAHKSFKFAIRIDSKDGSSAPDPRALTVRLKCSSKKEGCESESMNVAKQIKGNLYDGAWHVAIFPLADTIKKTGFDSKKVWELDLDTWSKTNKDFSVYIDDIAFSSD